MQRQNGTRAESADAYSKLRRPVWIAVAVGAATGLTASAVFRTSLLLPANNVEASQSMTGAAEAIAFGPTLPNTTQAPGPSPDGMVWIPGGEFSMGAMDPPAINEVGMHAAADARPIHRVYVDGFWMDKTDVTNEVFARFVKATSYVHCRAQADRGGFSGCAARESGRGFRRFFATRSSRTAL